MKTSFYLSGLVLFASLFTSCIKEPPCPSNLQKVEFVLDRTHVSLADYVAMEPGDEVIIFESEHLSMEQTDTVKFDRSSAIQRRVLFDGESFIPADGQSGFEPDKTDYFYCTGDIEQRIRVMVFDNTEE